MKGEGWHDAGKGEFTWVLDCVSLGLGEETWGKGTREPRGTTTGVVYSEEGRREDRRRE